MRINLTKSMHTATAALFIALFTLPTAAKAQSEELLEIGDIKVTADNCNDLSVIKGVSGTVKYDPATKVLTLQNAMIDIEEGHGIYSEVKGLAIRLIGVNNLKAKKAAIGFREALVITGGGTLNAESLSDCAFYAIETNLTIDNCTVNAKSSMYGISGNSSTSENLTINHATVTAEGTKRGSIRDFASLTLIGCNITQPAGAEFNAAKHCVMNNGEMVKSKVVITKDPTAIQTPTNTDTAQQGVFSIDGRRLSNDWNRLPKGIYIINGKKMAKQ